MGNRPTLTQHAPHRPASGVVHDPARLYTIHCSSPFFFRFFLPIIIASRTHALAVDSSSCRVAASTALRPLSNFSWLHTCHHRRPCRFPPLLHLPTPSPPQPTSNLLLSIPSPFALAASCAKPLCFQSWPALSLLFAPSRSARCVNHHGCFLLLTTNMSPYSDHPSQTITHLLGLTT